MARLRLGLQGPMSGWLGDLRARAFIALRYLPWLAALSLAWEAAHVPLYTLWREADAAYIAFAVVHCTIGDVLIGGAALLLALIFTGAGALAQWRWTRIGALTVFFGAGYTIFSEWMNVTILQSWSYAEAMPRITVAGFDLGLSPLVQWLLVPPLALYAARSSPARESR